MALTVFSMLTTTPLRKPSDLAVPTPTTLKFSMSSPSTAIAHIFVVPMSSPTIKLLLLVFDGIHAPRPINLKSQLLYF